MPIADIGRHKMIVSVALATKSTAQTAKSAITASPLSVRVLVMSTPPEPVLVAPKRGAIEPLIHTPQRIEAARVGRVGVIDDAVFEHERAHAWPLTHECLGVCATHL